MNAPIKINAEPIICRVKICSFNQIAPKINEITGDSKRMVEAFERLMYFNPQYHVRTYNSKKEPEIVM